jgi:7,8-dihydropterin-6-yl-methyl-4-(beta-D-ribofuranosyl)aminobenzene 5'-phosphate synthase
MFRQRALPLAGGGLLPIREIPSPDELSAKGAVPVLTTEPQVLLDEMFFVSGEIPRVTSYERGFPGHKRRSEDGESWEDDPLIMDERFVAVHVKGRGVVVLTACSHAGVVNVLKHAQSSFPSTPLYAVAGGFHLSGGNEKIIAESVRDVGNFGLKMICPGHCNRVARGECTGDSIWRRRRGSLSSWKNLHVLRMLPTLLAFADEVIE